MEKSFAGAKITFQSIDFVKEFLHTFGNPATFMATPQHLINASATASVSTPNPLSKKTVNIQIDINSYTFDNKLQY